MCKNNRQGESNDSDLQLLICCISTPSNVNYISLPEYKAWLQKFQKPSLRVCLHFFCLLIM